MCLRLRKDRAIARLEFTQSREFFDVEFRILIPRASNLALSLEIS